MRKEILFSILFVLMLSLASATISLEQTPKQIYNMGDVLEIPLRIIADTPMEDLLVLKLNCGTLETEIYKEYISLAEGEKFRDISMPLKKELIGDSKGTCSINYQIGTELGNLTSVFSISNKIILIVDQTENLFSPGDIISIKGEAKKENGDFFQGTIEANLSTENSNNMVYSNIVENGIFNIEINLPKNTKAGTLTINLYAYEKDKENIIINEGAILTTVEIKQIPTNLEILLDQTSINPSDGIKGKIILHDQTGESIDSETYVAIKNEIEEIVQKIELRTDQYFEHTFNYTQKPGKWKISAYVQDLTNTVGFEIKEHKKIETLLENNTLTVKNMGNVLYEDSLEIRIGDTLETLELNLKLEEEKTYTLTAPNGEYLVQVGEKSQTVSLTGKAIDIKEFSEKTFFVVNPIIWIFVVLILGFIILTLFRKGYKKTFFGKKFKRSKKSSKTEDSFVVPKKTSSKTKGGLIDSVSPAELSISLHGTKQQSDIISLNLKNHNELSEEGGVKETLQKVVDFAEELKAITYQTKDNLFFILAPVKTKTFKNESAALTISRETEKLLKHHNKLFKQKIDYGIAIDSGDLVIKPGETTKFMAMTNLMTNLKKISHHSDKEIYLSEKIRGRLGSIIKTERKDVGTTAVHKLKEIVKKIDNSKFVKSFVQRLERDKERLEEKERLKKKD